MIAQGKRVTLRCGPEGAPNFCFGVYTDDGECLAFVQSDWDYPGLAQSLGWSVTDVAVEADPTCEHDGTDGTVRCEGCGADAGVFLSAAYDWLHARDGHTLEYVT